MDGPYRLRVMDTYRNLFYTPLYAAVAGGFLYTEGLDVMFSGVPSGRSAVDMLRSGEADILQTGISRSMMSLDSGDADAPLHIAEINRRDGFFLVSRERSDAWDWRSLEDATLIPVGFTPIPLMTLLAAMRRRGVDVGKVRMLCGLSAEDAVARFHDGAADYIHLPNPQAQELVQAGEGYMAAELAHELGYLCYSSFAATPSFVDRMPDAVFRFVSGFYAAQQWVAAADARTVVERVKPFFASVSDTVLERGVAQYKALGVWSVSPVIGREGYDAMSRALRDGGLARGEYAYERLVRPEFAAQAVER